MNTDYNFNKSEVDIFNEIQQLNYLLKRIQQISWNYDQFHKRYGVQTLAEPEQYVSVLRSLDSMLQQAEDVIADYRKLVDK